MIISYGMVQFSRLRTRAHTTNSDFANNDPEILRNTASDSTSQHLHAMSASAAWCTKPKQKSRVVRLVHSPQERGRSQPLITRHRATKVMRRRSQCWDLLQPSFEV